MRMLKITTYSNAGSYQMMADGTGREIVDKVDH
jgi:hypothetical protein